MTLGARSKIFLISVVFIVTVGMLSGIYLEGRIRTWLEADLEADLFARAKTAAEVLSRTSEALTFSDMDPLADQLGGASGARVSIIAEDGRVLGDSSLSTLELGTTELHNDRPEFIDALDDDIGSSRRYSQTLGLSMFYVAKRFERPYGTVGVIRLALPMESLQAAVNQLRLLLVVASVGGLVVALTMTLLSSYFMTRGLRQLVRHTRDITGAPEPRGGALFGSEEIGGLAGSFKQLSEELEETVGVLASERNRVEAILENMSEAVLALDSDHRITLVNKTGLEILGLDDAPTGRALLEAMRSPALHELVREARNGTPGSAEFDWHGPSVRRLWARATPLPATGGSVLVMRDVTELRRLETVRRDFVANVSHELRTPVSVIRANIETLTEGALEEPEQARRFVEAAQRNADRLAALVGDLLDISRIEAGEYKLEPAAVVLWSSAERMCDAASVGADERGVRLYNELDVDLSVRADPVAIEQVLLNLIDNAVKYGTEGGAVHVRGRRLDTQVRVEVHDDGPGIEPKHRSRIFERFYRVDDGRSRAMGGTGLGLAIVKNLVEAMGGRVGVDPGHERGSVFWFQLDAAPSPVVLDEDSSGSDAVFRLDGPALSSADAIAGSEATISEGTTSEGVISEATSSEGAISSSGGSAHAVDAMDVLDNAGQPVGPDVDNDVDNGAANTERAPVSAGVADDNTDKAQEPRRDSPPTTA